MPVDARSPLPMVARPPTAASPPPLFEEASSANFAAAFSLVLVLSNLLRRFYFLDLDTFVVSMSEAFSADEVSSSILGGLISAVFS